MRRGQAGRRGRNKRRHSGAALVGIKLRVGCQLVPRAHHQRRACHANRRHGLRRANNLGIPRTHALRGRSRQVRGARIVRATCNKRHLAARVFVRRIVGPRKQRRHLLQRVLFRPPHLPLAPNRPPTFSASVPQACKPSVKKNNRADPFAPKKPAATAASSAEHKVSLCFDWTCRPHTASAGLGACRPAGSSGACCGCCV